MAAQNFDNLKIFFLFNTNVTVYSSSFSFVAQYLIGTNMYTFNERACVFDYFLLPRCAQLNLTTINICRSSLKYVCIQHSWQGGSYPPFLRFPPFQRNPRCSLTFYTYRSTRKTKVLNEPFNQLLYKFYPHTKYLNFGGIFTKVAKFKFDLMSSTF